MLKSISPPMRGYLFIIFGSVLFSTKAIMVKMAFRDTPIDAVSLLALRMLFAFPFFVGTGLVAIKKYKGTLPSLKEWIYIAFVGILGYYISSLLDFLGLQYITAGLERLILFLYPSFVVLINVIFFKESITKKQTLALVLCYAGLFATFYHESQITTDIKNLITGGTLIFTCSITYAMYIVGTGRILGKKTPVMLYTSFALIAASIGVFIHYFFAGKFRLESLDYTMTLYGLLLGIVATVLPNFIVSSGINKIGSSNAAIVSSIGPVSTIILAYFFLGEKMDSYQLVGTILVICGVLLVSKK